MQLQSAHQELLDLGFELYAISYDEPDALADFAAAHGITYPLLSDPDSEVIRAFGILNTLIPPDDHPWFGIPFPGTYLIDADGVITDKFFDANLAIRFGPEQLLALARGEEALFEELEPVDAVQVDVWIEGRDMPPGIQRDVVARFRVPDGQHLYDDPVPEGLVAATIEIESAHGLIVFDEIRPSTHPLELGDGTSLSVYDGDVVIRRPVTQNGQAGERIDGTRMVMIRGTVRWQACDDDQCGLPQRQAFELTVPAGRIVIPDTGPAAGKAVPMNGDKHLERMRTRRGV